MRRTCVLAVLGWVFSLCWANNDQIKIENNVYRDVVIAIHPDVPEDETLLDNIEEIFTKASETLFESTRRRAYFGNVNILIPKTWQGDYDTAEGLNYDQSDVRIAPPNPLYNNNPYTLQPGGCGEFGNYIHLTPDYVNTQFVETFGPPGNVLVREWAHYRYGVFDESYEGKPGTAGFYIDGQGTLQVTRCPSSIRNFFFDTSLFQTCEIDQATSLPVSADCRFVPRGLSRDISTSVMSFQFVPRFTHFCHDDPNDPDNMHNPDAPNEHNEKCNRRSTWSVVMDSLDFADGANPPNIDNPSLSPQFRRVKPAPFNRYMLVLDSSGSMAGDRLTLMRQIVSNFIDVNLPIGSHLGVVEFSSFAFVNFEVAPIMMQSDREEAINGIPTIAFGGTCIGCGIREGVTEMTKDADLPCGDIIVFTDGEENAEPSVASQIQYVLDNNCRIHTIFFTSSVNADLESLTDLSGGTWYAGDDVDPTTIIGAFRDLAEEGDGDNSNSISTIDNQIFQVEAGVPQIGQVMIDALLGRETTFTCTWLLDNAQPVVTLTAPSGCTFSTNDLTPNPCDGHPLAVIRDDLKLIRFVIPDIAEVGEWQYSITSPETDRITINVHSKAAEPDAPQLEILSQLTSRDPDKIGPGIVTVRVTRGGVPVKGLKVEATVTRPDTTSDKLELQDNGSSPDQTKDDGVYSNSFANFNDKGRYSLKVEVRSDNEVFTDEGAFGAGAAPQFAFVDENDVVVINEQVNEAISNIPPGTVLDASEIGLFTRVDTGTGLNYQGPVITEFTPDIFPPQQVTDLQARQIDINDVDSGIILTFTAPGDDANTGTATRYQICYTFDDFTPLLTNIDEATCVDTPRQGDINEPGEPGTQEEFVLDTPEFLVTAGNVRIHFAVRAFDEAGNAGAPSRIGSLSYFLEPPVIATPVPIRQLFTVVGTTSTTESTTGTTESTTSTTESTTSTTESTTSAIESPTSTTEPTTNTTGMRCLTCNNARNDDDCLINGYFEFCTNQNACQTEIRGYGDNLSVTKGCKQETACYNNESQNSREQCSPEAPSFVCRCCCTGDLCNIETTGPCANPN